MIAAFNVIGAIYTLGDFNLSWAKLAWVRLPDWEIAIGKFALEGGFDRREALVVLNVQGLVETSHVFFAQAIGTLPRCQCNAEGTSVGPAGGCCCVFKDRVQDVLWNLLIRVCAD